jgi:hypothetical protein
MSLLNPNPKSKVSSLTGVTPTGSLYLMNSLQTLPRILNLVDRYPDSSTYGCADLNFWKYRLLDVPNARYQEAAWLMALAYRFQSPLNRYAGNATLKAWALAAVMFWATHQNKDGSVTEVYPFERSFCATAFSTWAIAETLMLLRQEVSLQPFLPHLRNSGNWLLAHNNPDVANQMAAAITALHAISKLTGEVKYAVGANKKADWLLDNQHESGYFPEYGGCDFGYQSITMGAMARALELLPTPEMLEGFYKGLGLMESVVDDFGFYNFEETSRQTQYLYPAAFAFSKSAIVNRHLNGLEQDLVLNPTWMDDRYSIALAIDYWLAFQHLNRETTRYDADDDF